MKQCVMNWHILYTGRKFQNMQRTMFDGIILKVLAVVLEEETMNKFKWYNKQFFLLEIKIPDEKKLTL